MLKETYSPELINFIDAESMREYAKQLSYSNAKVVLCAKDIVKTSEVSKDAWFKTAYKVVEKPTDFTADDLSLLQLVDMHVPHTNRFIPTNVATIISTKDKQKKNPAPSKIELGDNATLWVLIDQVYLKPRSSIEIMLAVTPEAGSDTSSGSFLRSAEDRALFQVVCDCIRGKVNKEIGYEASLA